MIYYDFSKFQLVYCKRALRSTIHLSHGLRKKDPASLSIVTWGPSRELEAEEALKALDSGERSHAGGQEAGKSMRASPATDLEQELELGLVEEGPATVQWSGRRRRATTARFRRPIRGGLGPRSTGGA